MPASVSFISSNQGQIHVRLLTGISDCIFHYQSGPVVEDTPTTLRKYEWVRPKIKHLFLVFVRAPADLTSSLLNSLEMLQDNVKDNQYVLLNLSTLSHVKTMHRQEISRT